MRLARSLPLARTADADINYYLAMLNGLADLVQSTADWLFVPVLVIVLFGTGLFLTARLGAVQIRRFSEAVRAFFGGRGAGATGVLTPFQAFMTALGTTIGTGNIAGVAAGIASGGPGVLFWIWCYGFFATAIKFSEAVLGLTFREARGTQEVRSGPMFYLRDGFKSPALAMTYAVVAGVAALTTTPFTQTNSIALVMNTQVGVPRWISGVAIAVLTWLVIIGGIKSIGRAFEKLAPAKVGIYLVGSLIVIVSFASRLPDVLAMVFREAFTMQSALGFGMFTAIRYGLARGLYANEAGYGTAAVAYGTAQSERPAQQGLNAVMEVFIVSFGTCTLTALVVMLSGVIDWSVPVAQRATSTAAVGMAFDSAMPGFRRLSRGVLGVPVRVRHPDRLGLLRRAVPRILARPARRDALPLDLLPADPARRDRQGEPGVGLGRSHERAADLPEPDWRDRPERPGGGGRARPLQVAQSAVVSR